MFRVLAHTFCLSIAFVGIMTSLLNFTVIFSVLRTRPRGKFYFTVEVKAVSTPSRSIVLHPLRRAMLSLVLRIRPLSSINVLVIPQII
jgi:hypothetical protein